MHGTTCVANMKNIVNRVSLSQLVASVASRMSRRRKLVVL